MKGSICGVISSRPASSWVKDATSRWRSSEGSLLSHANCGNNFDNVAQDATFGKPLGFINPTSTTLPRAFTGEFGARFSF